MARSDSGVTAVEFAFIGPVFIITMGLMLETGLMTFTEFVLQSGVQRAAREVKTGLAQNANMSAADFKNKICTLVGVLVDCGKVYVYLRPEGTFATLNANLPDPLTVGPSYAGGGTVQNYSCGGPMQAVALVATYDWKFSISKLWDFIPGGGGGLHGLGNVDGGKSRRLMGLAVFRNEPFPYTKSCT